MHRSIICVRQIAQFSTSMSQAHIATAFHFLTSNFRCTSILWMAGRRDQGKKVNLRLDAFEDRLKDRFCPAGSLSSHSESPLSSEDAPRHAVLAQLSPDPSFFQPTSDNVIVFEVFTPLSQDECPVPVQDCYSITEEIRTPSREVTSPELGSSGYSGDEDEHMHAQEGDKTGLLGEILKLQQTVAQQRGEIKGLKMLLKERDAALSMIHSGSHRRDKGTMTTEETRTKADQLSASCKRYERQNLELRREIQSCTKDLLGLDKAKTDLFHSLQQAKQLISTYEQDFQRLNNLMDQSLQRSPEDPVSDLSLLSGYVVSKAEILANRMSRMQTSCDRLRDENERLVKEVEMGSKTAETHSNEQAELIKQLQARIKLKDRFIQKLERTLDGYKEKIREEDLQDTWQPSSKTENFSMRLKGLVKPEPEPSHHVAESDDDVFKAAFSSGVESLNNTLDPVQRKTDSSKVTGWKQRRRGWHHRTQSQNLFAPENYQPVLLARIKESKDLLSLTAKRPVHRTPKAEFGKTLSLERKRGVSETKSRGKSLQRR